MHMIELPKIFDHITREWDRETFLDGMEEAFATKQKRAGNDPQLYYKSLMNNITYLIENAGPIFSVMELCLDIKKICNQAFAEEYLEKQQQKIRQNIDELSLKYEKAMINHSIVDAIHIAESNYVLANIQHKLRIHFLMTFVNLPDSFFVDYFFKYPTQEVLNEIEAQVVIYGNKFI